MKILGQRSEAGARKTETLEAFRWTARISWCDKGGNKATGFCAVKAKKSLDDRLPLTVKRRGIDDLSSTNDVMLIPPVAFSACP